jgi:CheY-like chemotaxis protein
MSELIETNLDTVIVEDNPDCLKQLMALLSGFPRICLIGEAGDGKSAIELIQRSKPHLVFLDIHLPDMDGFQVLKHI